MEENTMQALPAPTDTLPESTIDTVTPDEATIEVVDGQEKSDEPTPENAVSAETTEEPKPVEDMLGECIDRLTLQMGIEPEVMHQALTMAYQVASEVGRGSISAATVKGLLNAIDYDRAVAAAELRGRNAQIEAAMPSMSEGDGLPHLCGGGATAPRQRSSIFDLAGLS